MIQIIPTPSVPYAACWISACRGASLRKLSVPVLGVRAATATSSPFCKVVGEEALIAKDDVHLDFRAAVGVDPARGLVRVTTVVRLKGWRGRLYFLPVRLLHSVIMHGMLHSAARRLTRT